MTEIGSAYVRIRPRTDGFKGDATRQLGPALSGLGTEAGEQFVRGADGKLRDSKGRFVKAGETAGGATSGGFASGFTSGLGKINISGVLGGIARDTGQAVAAGLAVGTTAVLALGTAAVRTQMEFGGQMGQVASVANATKGELASLREAAIEAGSASVFTATEAATAEAELVRAGVSVADVLGGALTGSLDLAAAGQLDLADSASIAAQSMNIFKLGGDQVTRIADVLAAGANKSAADVKQLGDALRQGGLVAGQLGIGLEDTVGTLSLFADNALVGSDAGTSFKTMLQRLVPQSEEQAKAMEALGLSFFDADGKFVGIEETAGRLQKAMSGLTDEQRAAAMTTIFGADAVRAANVLYEAGAAGVRDYVSAVDDQGAAQRMAATALDNLKGDLEAFGGEVETSQIRIGDLADRTLRSVVQGGEDVVGVFNEWATTPTWAAIQRNVDRLGVEAGGTLEGIAESLDRVLSSVSPADVDRVFGSIEGGAREVRDAMKGAEGVAAGLGISLASLGGRAVLGPLGGFLPVLNPVVGVLGGLVAGSDEGRAALGRLAKDGAKSGRDLGSELLRSVGSVADDIGADIGRGLETVGGAVLDLGEEIVPVIGRAVEDLGPPVGDLIENGSTLIARVLEPTGTVITGVLNPAITVLNPLLSTTADVVGLLADNTWLLVPALSAWAGVKVVDTVSGWGQALRTTATDAATSARDFRGYFGVLRAEGESVVGSLRGAGTATGGLAGSLTGLLNPAVLGVTAAIGVGVGVYEAWASAKNEAEQATRDLADALLDEEDLLKVTTDALRANIGRLGIEDAAARAGLSIREVSEEIRAVPGEFDRLRAVMDQGDGPLDFGNIFTDQWDQIQARADAAGVEIPRAVQQIRDAVKQGLITEDEGRELINAFVDADKATQLAASNIVTRFADIKSAAADLDIDLSPYIAEFERATKAGDFEAQKAVIEELKTKYPELADAIGVIEDAANGASSAVQGLRDQLEQLAGSQVDAEKATRDYAAAIDRMNDAFSKASGIDANTEAGRANFDAIDAAISQANKLAEAQALVDRTGQLSKATLIDIANQLGAQYEQGLLTSDEYAKLIDLYNLTPDEIDTQVNVFVEDAKAQLSEVQSKFDEVKAQLEEPVRNEIQTLLDEGKYADAVARLAELGLLRTSTIAPQLDEPSRASVEAKLRGLPGVTEVEKSRIRAELDAGNIAGVDALLNSLARDREMTVTVKTIVQDGGFGTPFRLDIIEKAQNKDLNGNGIIGQADGGILQFAHGGLLGALGGVPERHDAQIAPAGAWRVWAEPETGGEAYIPLAPSKRARSLSIWAETGRLLGADRVDAVKANVARYADGGIRGAVAAPSGSGLADPSADSSTVLLQQLIAQNERIAAQLAALAAAVTEARPIHVTETESPRRTAEEIVLRESRPGRMLTDDPRGT